MTSGRPTRESLAGEIDQLRDLVGVIADRPADDGVEFDTTEIRAEQIRDEDRYSGVRVTLTARLATASVRFHVDINIGDPIWPEPREVHLPRLLGGDVLLRGYPLPMVLAEKIVTAAERGQANARWRDFADIYLLTGTHAPAAATARTAIHAVATYRNVTLRPLRTSLADFADPLPESTETGSAWDTGNRQWIESDHVSAG